MRFVSSRLVASCASPRETSSSQFRAARGVLRLRQPRNLRQRLLLLLLPLVVLVVLVLSRELVLRLPQLLRALVPRHDGDGEVLRRRERGFIPPRYRRLRRLQKPHEAHDGFAQGRRLRSLFPGRVRRAAPRAAAGRGAGVQRGVAQMNRGPQRPRRVRRRLRADDDGRQNPHRGSLKLPESSSSSEDAAAAPPPPASRSTCGTTSSSACNAATSCSSCSRRVRHGSHLIAASRDACVGPVLASFGAAASANSRQRVALAFSRARALADPKHSESPARTPPLNADTSAVDAASIAADARTARRSDAASASVAHPPSSGATSHHAVVSWTTAKICGRNAPGAGVVSATTSLWSSTPRPESGNAARPLFSDAAAAAFAFPFPSPPRFDPLPALFFFAPPLLLAAAATTPFAANARNTSFAVGAQDTLGAGRNTPTPRRLRATPHVEEYSGS
eukprot:29101-Pelagococcus_subviridis.AAC.5